MPSKVWIGLFNRANLDPPLWLIEVEDVHLDEQFVAEKELRRLELNTDTLKLILKEHNHKEKLLPLDIELKYIDQNPTIEAYNVLQHNYTTIKLQINDKPHYWIWIFIKRSMDKSDFFVLDASKNKLLFSEANKTAPIPVAENLLKVTARHIWDRLAGPWRQPESTRDQVQLKSIESTILGSFEPKKPSETKKSVVLLDNR